MKYFIDIDGTICSKQPEESYESCEPIKHMIEYVNSLKDAGHNITLWTARGARSGTDWRELTIQQLSTWGVKYDVLSIGEKPDFDVLIDDKAQKPFRITNPAFAPRVIGPQEIVKKPWGQEIIIVNCPLYCGKILQFNAGYCGSLHFHLKKTETWYISKGRILFSYPDPATGILYTEIMKEGSVVTHKPGQAHIVEAIEDTDIFEISTQHFDEDSHRMLPSGTKPY